jgi:rod shape-determining protein MreD
MSLPIWQRFDLWGHHLWPVVLTLLLLLASAVPLPLPAYAAVAPSFLAMGIYFWTLHRPDLMPAVAVFVLGILQDLLSGAPVGASAIALLALRYAVTAQRRILVGGSFLAVWAGFVVNAAGVAFLSWLLHSFAYATLLNPQPALFQYLLTVGLYPSVGWALVRAQRTLLKPT